MRWSFPVGKFRFDGRCLLREVVLILGSSYIVEPPFAGHLDHMRFSVEFVGVGMGGSLQGSVGVVGPVRRMGFAGHPTSLQIISHHIFVTQVLDIVHYFLIHVREGGFLLHSAALEVVGVGESGLAGGLVVARLVVAGLEGRLVV